MTLPLNGISKPSQVALSAVSDLKVDSKPQYSGFISVAIDIDLDGKKYTVRRYFPEQALRGMSNDQIIQDRSVRNQMVEMVEKMVNIAIAYNIGREKKTHETIEEIALLRDQHTISRKIGNRRNEKDLNVVVPQKLDKYTFKKRGNEKKFEALQYLAKQYKTSPAAAQPGVNLNFKSEPAPGSDHDDMDAPEDLDALLNDHNPDGKGLPVPNEGKAPSVKPADPSDKHSAETGEMLEQLAREEKEMDELLSAAERLPVVTEEDANLWRQLVEKFQKRLSERLKYYPENTKDPEIVAVKDKIKELQHAFHNPNLKEVVKAKKEPKPSTPRANEPDLQAPEIPPSAVEKKESPAPSEGVKAINTNDKTSFKTELRTINNLEIAIGDFIDSLIKKNTLSAKDEETYRDQQRQLMTALDSAASKIPANTQEPDALQLKDKIEDIRETLQKIGHLPLKEMIEITKLLNEQSLWENDLREIERTVPQTYQIDKALRERKQELQRKIDDQEIAIKEILESYPRDHEVPLGSISEQIDKKPNSELEKTYRELRNQIGTLARLIKKAEREQFISDAAEEQYKGEHETFQQVLNDFDNAIPNDHPNAREMKNDVLKLRKGFSNPSLRDFFKESKAAETLMENRQKAFSAKLAELTLVMRTAFNKPIITEEDEASYKKTQGELQQALTEYERSIPLDHTEREEKLEGIAEIRRRFEAKSLQEFSGSDSVASIRQREPAENESQESAIHHIKTFSEAIDNLIKQMNEVIVDPTLIDDAGRFEELTSKLEHMTQYKKAINEAYSGLNKIDLNLKTDQQVKEAIEFVKRFYLSLFKTMTVSFPDLLTNKGALKNALAESHKELLALSDDVKKKES